MAISQRIKITPKIFNPVYWHLLKYLNDPDIRYIYVYGGSSAAKTYSIMQALSLESYSKGYNVLAMRKQTNNLKDTIFRDFKGFNNKLKKKLTDINIIQNEIITNNSFIRFKGVDDSEKLKGLSAFTKLLMDEITEYDYNDFKQARKRLRGRPNQQIITTWNPVSKDHWIKKKVLDLDSWYELSNKVDGVKYSELSENSSVKINKKGNSILIRTTYLDNYWVVGHPYYEDVGFYDKHTIEEFEHDKIHNPNDYNIYALGLWGNPPEGLVWKEIESFKELEGKPRENKVYWTKYETLPLSNDYFEIYAYDPGGAGGLQSDEPDGKSKFVFEKMYINQKTKDVYHKLYFYKGFIEADEAYKAIEDIATNNGLILMDDARTDLLTEMQIRVLNVIGAKTKEGKSGSVNTGIGFLKQYNHYYHVDDIPMHTERENHKWEIHKVTGEPTGKTEDKWKDTTDTARYGLTYYHLNYNF